MRRRNISILVSLLVLSLSLSFIAVMPVTGQDKSLIISKLQTLSNKLEGEHPCLQNKVEAVIHQIEAGAFHGALNKLQNDVKKSIATKVANPEELLKLVDEIINLIKGIKPSAPNFELEAVPDQLTVAQGSSTTSTIVATSINNFNKSIQLSITSLTIAGINTTITPSTVTPAANQTANATLTVRVATDAQLGQHTIIIKGTSCRAHHSVEVELTIVTSPPPAKPDFELTANPTELSIAAGSSGTSAIKVTSINGFNQQVNLTASTTASDIILTLQAAITPPPNSSATALLKVDAATNATTGDYAITITGTSGSLPPKTAIIALRITASSSDGTPPVIATVLRNPANPAYYENVTITAFVYDTQSGVKQVVLNYTSGAQWTRTNMTLITGLYQGMIPEFPFHTTVEYQVFAWDNADNMASSGISNYTVTDPLPPLARIITPAEGSYLANTVVITVFMMAQNAGGESGFATAELSINGTAVKTWDTQPGPAGSDTFNWDTLTSGGDGNYTIRLIVHDRAGNHAEKTITVTVDNTLPSATINQPTPGSYLRLATLIKVTGSDANFDRIEVRIDNALIQTFYAAGSYLIHWDTDTYSDGVHSVTLTVYDRADNIKQVIADFTVDNTPPQIGTPTWSPQSPGANINITIAVNVTDATPGSGIDKVTLMFKNKTLSDWRAIPMQFSDGNWTATLTNQSDTTITFFVEAFDRAGNSDQTQTSDFTVAAPTGVPLAWILAVIAAIAAVGGGTAYYVQRRRRRGSGASAPSTPTPAPS